MNTALIKAQELTFSYEVNARPGDLILKNLSFEVRPGELMGVIGPNGGGKSTLLGLLLGKLIPTSGMVEIKSRTAISYLAQSDQGAGFFPLLTRDILNFATFKNKSAGAQLEAIAQKLGLTELLQTRYRELSGGQKQRVLLAKAFLEAPQVLLLDEPTKGLDAQGQDQLLHLIKDWVGASGTPPRCAVIVDHNLTQLLAHSDRIMCLNRHAHWHDSKDKFTPDVLNNVYHCEFEHLLIHEHGGHQCS